MQIEKINGKSWTPISISSMSLGTRTPQEAAKEHFTSAPLTPSSFPFLSKKIESARWGLSQLTLQWISLKHIYLQFCFLSSVKAWDDPKLLQRQTILDVLSCSASSVLYSFYYDRFSICSCPLSIYPWSSTSRLNNLGSTSWLHLWLKLLRDHTPGPLSYLFTHTSIHCDLLLLP